MSDVPINKTMTNFAHGVASFDPTRHSVLIWTRLTGAAEAEWTVASDPDFVRVVARGRARTGPDRDHTVVVDVEGLEPGTSYWYRFDCSGKLSPSGRTRTLPEGQVSAFTVGMVSCARYSVAPLTVYRALARTEVDLVLHLGDYIYDDAGDKGPRSHDPPREVRSLSDYRTRLAQLRLDPDCQSLHARHPMVFLWDDHDFADNAWRDGAKEHDPQKDGPWSERRDAAVQAHEEWLPWRRTDPAEPLCIYRSLVIGDLAELILLDSRIIGRDCQASLPGGKPVGDPTRSLLGPTQWAWLEDRLLDSSYPWALVADGVVFNPIPIDLPFAKVVRRFLPQGYVALEGRVLRDDQWDGYPVERDRLIKLLGARSTAGAATVLVSADVHSSWAFEGPIGPDGTPVTVEATVPSVSSTPMGRTAPPGVWRLLDYWGRRMEHVRWMDVTSHGFTVLRLAPEEVRAGWCFVDPYDTALEPRVECGAAFRCRPDALPPVWEIAKPPQPPAHRIALPKLPPRPDDVEYLRRWHRRRRNSSTALVGAGTVAAIAILGRLTRRRARRR